MISATTGEWYWILGTRIDIWWYMLATWVSKASVKDDQRLAAGHCEKRWHVAHRFDRPWENRGFLSWINGASTALRINMGYASMLLYQRISWSMAWGYDSTINWQMCHRFILSQTSAILWVHLEPLFFEPDSRAETAIFTELKPMESKYFWETGPTLAQKQKRHFFSKVLGSQYDETSSWPGTLWRTFITTQAKIWRLWGDLGWLGRSFMYGPWLS